MTKAKKTKAPSKALTVPHAKTTTRYVVGPDGAPLSLATLPAPNTSRWVIRRKAEVVLAVRGGLLTLQDALTRYNLSDEEFQTWAKRLDKDGPAGMRTTRIQEYRR